MRRLIRRFGYSLLFFPIVLSILLMLGTALLFVSDSETGGNTKKQEATTNKKKAELNSTKDKKKKQTKEDKSEDKKESSKEGTTGGKKEDPSQKGKEASDPVSTETSTETPESSSQKEDKTTQDSNVDDSDKKLAGKFSEGEFIAGKTIQEGEYLITEKGDSPYFEIKNDKGQTIVSNTFHNRTYITVKKGETIALQQGEAELSENAPSYDNKGTYYPEGQYLVGKDLPEGKYSVRPDKNSNEGSYSVCDDSTGSLSSITQSEMLTEDKVIILSDGKYISLTGLEMAYQKPEKKENSEEKK